MSEFDQFDIILLEPFNGSKIGDIISIPQGMYDSLIELGKGLALDCFEDNIDNTKRLVINAKNLVEENDDLWVENKKLHDKITELEDKVKSYETKKKTKTKKKVTTPRKKKATTKIQ
jgi:regulator of replication initiation timing